MDVEVDLVLGLVTFELFVSLDPVPAPTLGRGICEDLILWGEFSEGNSMFDVLW